MKKYRGPTKTELCALASISGSEFDQIADAASVAVGDVERGEITVEMWQQTVRALLNEVTALRDAKKAGKKGGKK